MQDLRDEAARERQVAMDSAAKMATKQAEEEAQAELADALAQAAKALEAAVAVEREKAAASVAAVMKAKTTEVRRSSPLSPPLSCIFRPHLSLLPQP